MLIIIVTVGSVTIGSGTARIDEGNPFLGRKSPKHFGIFEIHAIQIGHVCLGGIGAGTQMNNGGW